MKIVDIMPIAVIVTALLANIAIGVNTGVDFPMLMVRCIIVTIVFGILSYMLAKTIDNAVEFSQLSKLAQKKSDGTENGENSSFDIKVPPLDDTELLRINRDSDNDFVEVNPVHMKGFKKGEQE